MAKTQYANLAEEAFATAFIDQYDGVTDGIEADASIPTPVTFGEKFDAGFDAGRAGLSAGAQSFGAIGNALIGDEQGVADRLAKSSFYNQEASNALSELETFQEFYDNPTWDGFVNQFATGLGQAAPSALATVTAAIATGGASVIGQAAGKGVLSVGSKVAMKRVLKEAADNAADGVASKAEKELVGQVYKTFKKGAYAGAAATSFVPLSGQNFDEGIEAGREPDAALAMRSLLVAVPQAALDVGVEAALLKSFTKVVRERGGEALKSGSMATLLKEIGKGQAKGTVSEAFAEGGQEAISVANRAQMDPNFSASSEEAFMRIAQNAFLGGIGGFGMGTAGGTLSGSAKAIFAKADKLAEQGRTQRAEQQQEKEEYGDLNTGNTTEESMADINAQLSAMFDTTSTKKAVWAAGEINDSFRQSIPSDNTTTPIEINGNRTHGAYIPGRGVIVGDKTTVDAVVAEGATDLSLQQALGYSQNKKEGARTNIVVQAINKDGQIVSEEVTDKEGLGEAFVAAEGLAGDGGTVKKVSLAKALRARKQRLDKEKGPKVRERNLDATMGFEEEDGLDEVRNDFGDQYDLDYGPEVRDMDTSEAEIIQSVRAKTLGSKDGQPTVSGQPAVVTRSTPKDEKESTATVKKTPRQPDEDIRYDDEGNIVYASVTNPSLSLGDRPTFRTNILAGLKNALAKNPENARILNLIKRFEEGGVEQQDEIIRTIFDTDSSTDAPSATSEPASFEEDSTATFKNDPDQMFPNTESARASYVEAFGPVNWSDPFYSRMTESFLEKAAALKAEDPSTYIDADRDSKGDVYQYTLFKQESETATDFDESFADIADIDRALELGQSSQYSNGGAFVVTPDGSYSPINLVNLAVEGTKILRDRGETNWDTPAANYKAGLVEFLKQLSNTYPDYQIRVGQSLTTYSVADVLSGKVQVDQKLGQTPAARIDGQDVSLSDLAQTPASKTEPNNFYNLTYNDAFGEQVYINKDSEGNPLTRATANLAKKAVEKDVKDASGVTVNSVAKDRSYTVRGTRTVKQATAKLKNVKPINVFYGSSESPSLSNLALRSFIYNGNKFLTVEHAYQTLKGGSFNIKTFEAYNRLPNAAGKKIIGPRADTKNNANIRLMEALMRASFEQNPDAARDLINTSNAKLTHNQDKGVWKKEFPRILTDIRKSLQPNNNVDTSTTQINFRSEPAPQSDIAQSSSESLARQQSVDAMNRSQQQSTEQAAKSEFTNEQEVTEYYNTAEEADARSEVLRSEFGFDVTITDPVTKAKTGAQTPPVQVNDDGRQTQATPDDGPNDAPSTYLNLEGGTSTQGRSGRPTPNAKPKFVPIQYPAGAVNKLVTQIADAMNKAVKLKNSVVIMGVKQLKTMTDAQIKEMFDDPRVGSLIIEQLKDLSNADSKLGKYIEFGDSHVIIVDNTKGNELQAALTVAHEMGHALFNEELDGSLDRGPTRDRLRKAFMRAQAKKDAPAAYQANNPYAFEEWFADQTAIWAKSFLNEPLTSKGLVDSHFKRIAIRLQKMWKALDRVMRQRFSSNNKSQTFDSYINAFLRVRKTYRRSPGVAARKTSWQKKALVREMEKTVEDTGAKDPVLRLLRGFGKLLDNPKGRMLKKIFLPEDNILRKISPAIADMFYVQSNSGSGLLGFLNAKTNRSNAILNDLEDIVGAKWDTKEVEGALAKAADDEINTEDLTGKAKEVRQYLEKLYDNYIALTPGNQIAKSKNYFPVSLALAEIYNDQEAFIAVVKKYNPDMTDRAVRDVVTGLVRKREHIVEDGDIQFDATDPQKMVEKARILTKNIKPEELKKFLEKPEVALIRYVRHITIRSEFLRATRDKDGKDLLAEAMAGLSPDEKERATNIIERYLGYTTKPLNPAVQKINSYLQLFNWITLLPLATIGSIPEFGGAIVNTREFNGFEMALKAITKTVKDRAQAKQLARSLGVSVSTAMGNLGLTDADAEFLDPKVRKLSDGFFKVIGLDFFTRFTREFGAAMGVEFLITHAANTAKNPRAARYLSELNVTAEQITAWNAQQQEGTPYTFNGPEGQAVKDAVTRFVESSMLRPNAAERPAWGNDPMWTLVWALKSFLYSFGKVIIGGVKREMMVRSQEGATNFDKMGGVAMMGGLMAAAFLPLAMVGLELREIAKAGVAGVLPGVDANARYFRSDRMDYGEYLGELINRAGFYGPLAIFSGAFDQVGWGKSGLGSLFGPTAGLLIDDIGLGYFKEGKTWEILPERIIPGYNLVL